MAFLDSNRDRAPTLPSDTEGKLRNQILSLLVTTLQNIFPRTFGTFTLAAAATTTVTEPAVKANSDIQWTPKNAAAGTLLGSAKSLYVSAITPGVSFTVATASGAAAAGTEQFSYVLSNPV
jgi:hypothetical protein